MNPTIQKHDPLLSVSNLEVHFIQGKKRTHAVDGLTFDLNPGEILGMVGESGSGKSVTALALLRLVRPPGKIVSGSIQFDGNDLRTLSEADMRKLRGRSIGMISQDPITSLNPVMTIGEQVARLIRLHVEKDARKARQLAIDALRNVEIPSPERRMEQYPHELSGGMCQRVVIAMAMVSKPRLLIADEPTTALDVTIQSQILNLLLKLREENNVSIVFISHDLAVVAEIADRVLVMYAGREMEYGTVDQVLREPHHPYTQALLQSMPHLGGQALRKRVPTIPGTVPSLTSDVSGCLFAPRCEYAFEQCLRQRPPLLKSQGGQAAACWLLETSESNTAPLKGRA